MATKIVTKNSSTASAVPTASDLVQGELAVNVADKRLFTEDNAGAIVELGTNPSTLTVTGEITANGGIALGDGDVATFGDSDDLSIFHAGGTTYLTNTTGSLVLRTDSFRVLNTANSEQILHGDANGAVTAYYDNSVKLATTSTGIDVTGTATMDGLTVDTTTPFMSFKESGATKLFIGESSAVGGGAGYYDFYAVTGLGQRFFTNSVERMRIDSAGNLLVGQTTNAETGTGIGLVPDGTSHMYSGSTDALMLGRGGNDGDILSFNKSGTTVGSVGALGANAYINSQGGTLKISTVGTERYNFDLDQIYPSVDNDTNLGLSSKRFKDLYLSGEVIAGAGANNNPSITSHVDTDTGLFFGGGNILGFSTGGGERMRIDSSGNLLVSTTGIPTTGGFRFDAGSDSILRIGHASGVSSGSNYLLFYYGSSIIGSITQNGTSQVLYNISSDQRLKENIVDAPSASDDIDAIQVRSFDWKADGEHQKYGMIAQELQTVAPEAVHQPEDSEEMMGVDYSKLVPMLIKEIQSLRNRVAQLEE